MFKVGDRVAWTAGVLVRRVVIGTVVNVMPNDNGLDDFNIYDVFFDFGLRTLHGSELTVVTTSAFHCQAREHLFKSYKIAIDAYSRLVKQLVDLVGMAAHTEFEFLSRRAETARGIARGAGERLKTHRAEHGC